MQPRLTRCFHVLAEWRRSASGGKYKWEEQECVGKRQAALQLPQCHTAPKSLIRSYGCQHKHRRTVNMEDTPPLKAQTPSGGHVSLSDWPPAGAEMWLWVLADAAELWLLCQRPLSEYAMTEITVMRLARHGGLVMLVSTCCTDVHKC